MIIITLSVFFIMNIKHSLADLWFFNNIKRMIGKQVKGKTIKGTVRKIAYLGSVVKISCFGKKHPTQSIKRFAWFHSGKRLSKSDHFRIDKHGNLIINGVIVEDSGGFVCLANSKSGKYMFKHNVNVIQFPSRSLHIHFVYVVRFCSSKSETFASHFIESKVKGKLCLKNECKLGFIHSSCYFEKFANPRIQVTVPILLPGIPNGRCNIQCLREKQDFLKEEVKQKVISAVIQGSRLKIREEPKEISISYLETEDDKICDSGFEMKGSVCLPCTPGHFLENGYCIPCHLNYYSKKYGATKCHTCFGNRITRSRGAISEEDCYLADPDVLWILLWFFITVIVLILFCCCCPSLCRRKKKLIPNKVFMPLPENHENMNTGELKQSFHETFPKRKIHAVESSFIIPSARHSVGKDFLYKPIRPVTKGIPPPPALPTDSALNQATRKMTTADRSDVRGTERSAVDSHATNKMTDIFLKGKNDIPPQYRERMKKNKPMYNAYMKSKV